MNQMLPKIYLARHGQTEWTITGQHTGRTDLSLTEQGKKEAQCLGERLKGMSFSQVFTSPLLRARQTCELAGFAANAQVEPDLMEWHYGDYEGRTTREISQEKPDWYIFRDGCPGGETIDQVAERAKRMIDRLRKAKGDVLIFSHGHFLRFLASGWLGLSAVQSRFFLLNTASLSILGYEHNKMNEPVIRLWNDDLHVIR